MLRRHQDQVWCLGQTAAAELQAGFEGCRDTRRPKSGLGINFWNGLDTSCSDSCVVRIALGRRRVRYLDVSVGQGVSKDSVAASGC